MREHIGELFRSTDQPSSGLSPHISAYFKSIAAEDLPQLAAPQDDDADLDPIGRWLHSGWSSLVSGTGQTLGGAIAGGAVLTGADPERGRQFRQRASGLNTSTPLSWEEATAGGFVDDIKGVATKLGELTASGLGSFAPVLAAGGAGAAMGSVVPGVGTAIGGAAGAFSAGLTLAFGETFNQLEDEGVESGTAAKAALALAPVIGALDALGAGKVVNAAVGTQVKQGVIKKIVADFGKGYLRGARAEGLTEFMQSAAREGLAAALTGNPDVKRRALAALEEGLAGGLAGGAISGSGAAARGAAGAMRSENGAATRPDLMRGNALDDLVEEGAQAIGAAQDPDQTSDRQNRMQVRQQAETDRFASAVGELAGSFENVDADSQISELLEDQDATTIAALPVEKRAPFLKSLKQRIQKADADRVKQVETDQTNAADDVVFDDEVKDVRGLISDTEKATQIDADVRQALGIDAAGPVKREIRKQYMTLLKRRMQREAKKQQDAATAAEGSATAAAGPTATPSEPPAPVGATSPATPVQGAAGSEGMLRMPSGEDQPVRYRVVEASSLIPSHNPLTFGIDPRYPEGVQERTYHSSKEAQKKVQDDARQLRPDLVASTDPTPTGGPPQITSSGIVLGGNGRTMAIQRAYKEGTADEYRRYIAQQADQFGLDPAQVEGMQQPVLVREITNVPADTEGLRKLGRDMNKGMTKGLSEVEAAVSAGKNLTQTSADRIAVEVEGMGGDVSLRQMMEKNPILFRDILLADGIVSETDLPKYFTSIGGTAALNPAGKDFIENALVGSFIADADLMGVLPKSLTAKLERIVPSMMELSPREDGWNIVDSVREAAKLVSEAQIKGMPVSDLLRQQTMFTEPTSPIVEAITRVLARKPTEVAQVFKAFAREARQDIPGQEALFGKPDPVEAFARIFDYEPAPRAAPAAVAPQASDASPPADAARLPDAIRGAKPRYGYRNANYTVAFESDTDLALYITAQKRKSKRDADYRGFLRGEGLTDDQIVDGGTRVRDQIKELAAAQHGAGILKGTISLPAEQQAGPDAAPELFEPDADEQARLADENADAADVLDEDAMEGMGADLFAHAGDRPTLPSIEEAERKALPPDLVRKSDILRKLSQSLGDIPIRIGRISQRKAHGIYKVGAEAIRLRRANDVPVAAHEIGHHINKILYGGAEGRLNWRPLDRFRDELAAIATPSRKNKSVLEEGFAEFVRLYVTDPDAAKEKAPKMLAEFETELYSHPEMRDGLEAAQRAVKRYVEQPAQSKTHSMIRSASEKIGIVHDHSFTKVYTATIDRLNPIREVVADMQDISEMGADRALDTEKDAYKMARLAAGWMGKADRYIRYGTLDFHTLEDTGKGLQQIIEPILRAGRRDAFDDYLAASRAIELEDRGIESGFDVEAAKQTVTELRGEFGDAASEIYAYQDRMLDYRIQAGLLSEADAERIRAANKNYVPFRRVQDETARQSSGTSGESLVNLGSGLKRIKGSGREIISPLESMLADTLEMVSLADRNRVGQLLAAQAKATDGSGKWFEPVPPKMRETSFQLAEIKKVLKDRGLFVEGMPSDTLNALVSVYRPDMRPSEREGVISVLIDGKPQLYQVHPDLQKALTPDPKVSGPVISFFASITRLKRAGATGVNPEFVGTNIIRDAFTAFIQSRNGFIPGLDTARGLFHALKKDRLYEEWLKAGGAQSALVSMDRAHLQQSIDDMIATPMQWVVAHPIDALRIFGELSENATRMGEYRKARLNEKSARTAALDAREVTLDFARHGASDTIRAINSMTAFYNAAMQGTDKFLRSVKENPKGVTFRAAIGITVPSMILYALNKDDDEYKEQPSWLKDMFWLVPLKGTPFYEHSPFMRIPKPHLPGALFGTSMERTMDWIVQKDPKAFDGFLGTVSNATLPGTAGIPIPDVVMPAVEWWANKSLFRGGPIVPMSLERLPERYQAQPWTSEYATGLADLAHRAGIEVSPIKIENAVFGMTAGTGRMVAKLTDPVLRSGDDPERPATGLADRPIIRAFAVRPNSGSGQSIERFYERIGELDKKRSAESYGRRYRRQIPAQLTPIERREHGIMVGARTRMQKLSLAAKRAETDENLSPDEKRDRIADLNRRRTDQARRALDAVRSFGEG